MISESEARNGGLFNTLVTTISRWHDRLPISAAAPFGVGGWDSNRNEDLYQQSHAGMILIGLAMRREERRFHP